MNIINDKLLEFAPTESHILEACEYFSRVRLWPTRRKLDYINWLKNFTEGEKPYALSILSSFRYINDDFCNEIFKDSFIKAGQSIVDYESKDSIANQWKKFFETCIICPVRGEIPSLADSGFSYVKKARDIFGIEEDQFMDPIDALDHRYRCWRDQIECVPIIFIDDFIGSGNQFYTMWAREKDMFNIEDISHQELSRRDLNSKIFYCSMLSTSSGFKFLTDECYNLNLCIGHIIESKESIFDVNSTVWQGEFQNKGIKAIKDSGKRYGIPDTDGEDVDDWKGYKSQGLLLGIRDGVPDATISAIRWNKNGWQPLVKKN